jgi:Holliday junction resolvase
VNTPKAKGDRFERDVVAVLKAHGHRYAERALRLGAHEDHADVAGIPGFHIECKNHARIELGAWMAMATLEAARIPSRPVPVLVVKRKMKPADKAYVVMQLEDFATLIADEVTA